MEVRLELCALMLLIQVSLAVWQRVTVEKGQTLTLSCPLLNALKNPADWKNPEGFIMFFNRDRVLKDKRYSINKLSQSEFSISVSNVTFKDGGNYTCSEYNRPTIEKKVEVTVLGHPRMTVAKHDGKTVIKCTAEGNHHSPQISWQMDDGPEFFARTPEVHREDKKYISVDHLHVNPAQKRVAVKCLVRHPALHSRALMDFVKIGRDAAKPHHRTTPTSSHTAQPQGPTQVRTTEYLSNTDVNGQSEASSATSSAAPPTETKLSTSAVSHGPSTASHLSTTEISESSDLTTVMNGTISNETSTEVMTNDPRIQTRGGSSLLVFLVTCLIVCLLVVVIFFAIKLRRAHIIWKRENEESDPSEDSSKSKSSQEDKNAQAQRRRGPFNTAFTQYIVDEPTMTSVVNTGAMAATTVANNGHTSQAQTRSQTATKADIKETEL